MKILSQDLMSAFTYFRTEPSSYVRFMVDAFYLDDNNERQTDGITVTITAAGYTQVNNYIDVPIGTSVAYSVTKNQYHTKVPVNSPVTVVGDSTVSVEMTKDPMWNFVINTTPDDALAVMNGVTQNTKQISVAKGTVVSWAVSRSGMNSTSGVTTVPPDSSASSGTYTQSVVLTSTLTLTTKSDRPKVSPQGAQITWSYGVGDVSHDNSVTVPCTNSVSLTITKDGYQSFTKTDFPTASGKILNYEFDDTITLTPLNIPLTLTCNIPTATCKLEITARNIVQQANQSVTLNNCHMGDVVKWTVSKAGYQGQNGQAQTGYITIDSEHPAPIAVSLEPFTYTVTITANPSYAVIYLSAGGQSWSGIGSITRNFDYGTTISFYASYGGITSDTTTATITADYSNSVSLDPTEQGTQILTSSQTLSLSKGVYKYIAISGGGAGYIGTPMSVRSLVKPGGGTFKQGMGGEGGPGGGSGRISFGTFTLDQEQTVLVTIGAGGVYNTNNGKGGDTSIKSSDLLETFAYAEGGDGGSMPVSTQKYGGDGGSGGGSGGKGGSASEATGSSTAGTAGARGANGGGNGERTDYAQFIAGVGYYNTAKSYENNAGAYMPMNCDTSIGVGGGGRGIVSIRSSITDDFVESLNENTNLGTLYNALGGGGSGGGTWGTTVSGYSGDYAGPGGGGGGWIAGSAGTAPDWTTNTTGEGGSGGAGALILLRTSWS